MKDISFADIAIVSCGTLSLELNYLKQEGFLDTPEIYYTTPGLHEAPVSYNKSPGYPETLPLSGN